MTKRPPAPISYIRSFEASARHLSFTQAASELGYTQAAISAHVRGLEKYLGRTLFVRNARSLELTEIGESFLPTLRQALAQIDNATEAIAKTSPEDSVLIACPISLAQSWLADVLASFWAGHPDVEVLVHGTVWDREAEDMADLAISIHRHDEAPAQCRQLLTERLIVLCAPELATDLVQPEDILLQPRILVSGRQDLFTVVETQLGLPTSATPRDRLRTSASNVALDMAARGLGVTVALSTLAAPYLARGQLVDPIGLSWPSPWGYYISTPSRRLSGPARALLKHIKDSATAAN